MTYNREKILKMLSNAPIYEGIQFHEGRNDEFLIAMDDDFCYDYDYAHGATKLALIPIDEKKDYVIKIPYTGSYNYESSYYDSHNSYHHGREDYWEYYSAEDDKEPWNYCAGEVNRYKIAEESGFSQCFAKTELLGYINGYPIYIQERCITLSNSRGKHSHSKEEKETTSKICGKYCNIDEDWLTDFRLYYGDDLLFNFINFIKDMAWDDDLRSDNIGYIKNRPVLIDYSGFLD